MCTHHLSEFIDHRVSSNSSQRIPQATEERPSAFVATGAHREPQRDTTGHIRTAEDHRGPRITTEDHRGPQRTTGDHQGPQRTTENHRGPHGTTADHRVPERHTEDHRGVAGYELLSWLAIKLRVDITTAANNPAKKMKSDD